MSVESKFENKYKNYKEEFTELLDEVVEGSLPVLPEMRAELDEVYAQAAKADEYEAKAKAFDEIMKVFENNFGAADSIAKFKVFTEVENAYIESGEYDA